MTDPCFVDTNLLVYRHDSSDAGKQARADAWYAMLWERRLGHLSYQVLQELYATLTRGRQVDLNPREARDVVEDLLRWRPIGIDTGYAAAGLGDRGTLSPLVVGRAHRGGRSGERMPGPPDRRPAGRAAIRRRSRRGSVRGPGSLAAGRTGEAWLTPSTVAHASEPSELPYSISSATSSNACGEPPAIIIVETRPLAAAAFQRCRRSRMRSAGPIRWQASMSSAGTAAIASSRRPAR